MVKDIAVIYKCQLASTLTSKVVYATSFNAEEGGYSLNQNICIHDRKA